MLQCLCSTTKTISDLVVFLKETDNFSSVEKFPKKFSNHFNFCLPLVREARLLRSFIYIRAREVVSVHPRCPFCSFADTSTRPLAQSMYITSSGSIATASVTVACSIWVSQLKSSALQILVSYRPRRKLQCLPIILIHHVVVTITFFYRWWTTPKSRRIPRMSWKLQKTTKSFVVQNLVQRRQNSLFSSRKGRFKVSAGKGYDYKFQQDGKMNIFFAIDAAYAC